MFSTCLHALTTRRRGKGYTFSRASTAALYPASGLQGCCHVANPRRTLEMQTRFFMYAYCSIFQAAGGIWGSAMGFNRRMTSDSGRPERTGEPPVPLVERAAGAFTAAEALVFPMCSARYSSSVSPSTSSITRYGLPPFYSNARSWTMFGCAPNGILLEIKW